MSAHVRRATGVAVLSLATALAQTAPLALHLGSAIPFGTYPAPVVPRLNLWALWWNSERLLHGYRGYWQAPIFHPDPFAFAYTEPQWLSGLVAGALWWTTARPALAYDAVVLIAFTLNGCCGYFLLRRLRIGFWPALCGGLVIEMLPFVADQIGVLQSTVLFPIPMTLACLVGFGRTGSAWSALGGVLWMAVCYHTSANTALFFGPAALLALLVFGGRRLLDARSALVLAVVGLVGALLVVPTAVVQERVLAQVQPDRPESMVRATSARPEAYLQMPATNLLRRRPPDRRAYALYPGTGLILLALVGSWHGLRHRGLRRWTLYGLAVVVAFVLLSFGPLLAEASFGSLLGALYAVLRAAYPGFRLARNLWCFGGLAQVFLATLAGFGLAASFGPEPHRPRRALLGGALTVALGLELFSAAIPLLDLGRKPRTRVGALAPRFAARDDDHPYTHGRGRDAGRLRAHDVLDVLPDVSRPAHGERLLGLHPRQHGAAEARHARLSGRREHPHPAVFRHQPRPRRGRLGHARARRAARALEGDRRARAGDERDDDLRRRRRTLGHQ